MAARLRKQPAPADQRLAILRDRLAKSKADAILLTQPVDLHYLTGFTGEDSWALVPLRRGKVTLISDRRFEEDIASQAPDAAPFMRTESLPAATAKVIAKKRFQHIAFEASQLSVADRNQLAKAARPAKLLPTQLGMMDQRAIKEPSEVDHIRKAIAVQQKAFLDTCKWLKPGRSEVEVAAYLEYRIRIHGGQGVSFPTIVAADDRSSLPHAVPSDRKLKQGGCVLFDWGARVNGYCSDMTRVVALGKMPRKIANIYQIVLDAQLAAIDAIAPGVPLAQVDAAARKVIRKAGFAKEFLHSTGHGIGLEIHEEPRLSAKAQGALQPGHVVTVEPGIYLPGIGGVRIEDDVLVSDNGHQVLSDLPKDLASATL
ncbi:MAG: aminopeptidase P family protein [Phycisphaeraceae bacterium]